jgi:glycosyltransferase involved in cell wall biosynthesis
VTVVSVVIAVHDGARFLAEALASVHAQELAPDEVIVVDDGSRDDSAAIADRAGARVVAQRHLGVAAARNRGVAAVRGELVAFLDADDAWTPDKLRVQVAHLLAHPGLGFTFTHQRFRCEPGVPRPSWAADDLPCVGTGAMLVRARVLAEVGPFDPALASGEDTDWIVRATDRGVAMAIVPRALLVRRVHGANLSMNRPAARTEMLTILRASIARKRGGC